MTPADWIAIAAILLLIGGAAAYLIRAKRKGAKCVGCPYCRSCGTEKGKGGCGGSNKS